MGREVEREQTDKQKVMESGVDQPWRRPPSKEEIKRQLKDSFSQREYDRQYAKNKKEAIQEILQEQVQNSVRVRDSHLTSQFEEGRKSDERR